MTDRADRWLAQVAPEIGAVDPERLRARLMEVERPGVAKARAALSESELCILRAKDEFRRLLDDLGLGVRECARAIDRDESAVRNWLDPRKLGHSPPTWVLLRLGKPARLAFVRATLDDVQKTGTE